MCIRDSIMTRMQLVRSSSLKKCKGISSFLRNASFNKGWLHLAVQGLFAIIIVVSFILIILMAIPLKRSAAMDDEKTYRCYSKSCIVFCNQVPYFDKYEDDIIYVVSQLPSSCWGFYLALHRPMFHNGTLEPRWLSGIRLPIIELGITGGNLHHFTPHAFLNLCAANIRSLVLHDLVIKTWATDSFVGLSSLQELTIQNCTIINVEGNVFRSVHDTLRSLTISKSQAWDPTNITGTTNLSHLKTVDFSNNVFNDILGKNSFTGIEKCRMLYLNSCNISAIGEGAFDNLYNIETLFLNDNNLVRIPPGLFNNILKLSNPRPRINLHDNNWHCDCRNNDIRKLVYSDVMLTHPICRTPRHYAGRTFNEVVSQCNYSSHSTEQTITTRSTPGFASFYDITSFVYISNGCYNGNDTSKSKSLKVFSPLGSHECTAKEIQKEDLQKITISRNIYRNGPANKWIKFAFFLNTNNYTVIQINSTKNNNHGILWYQSTCPNEVYCVDVVPGTFKIINIDSTADYVFCPMAVMSGDIENERCVTYNLKSLVQTKVHKKIQILLVILTGGISLIMGALCVYALVRKHPSLLKGSKRIVFVKHKTVDALVLPPKVPIRNDLENEHRNLNGNIFVVPANSFDVEKFSRNISTRSSKSYAPSYISAVQPSEGQLAEWRIRNNLTNELTSELSVYSWLCNADTHVYTDVIDNDKTYESLK